MRAASIIPASQPEPANPGVFKIFRAPRHRNFRLLWIGLAVSAIGTWLDDSRASIPKRNSIELRPTLPWRACLVSCSKGGSCQRHQLAIDDFLMGLRPSDPRWPDLVWDSCWLATVAIGTA